MNSLFGFRLIENPHIQEFFTIPNKRHFQNSNMSNFYHKRIQKKWNKRFGCKTERQIIKNGDNLIAHPKTIELIKKNING